MNPTTTGSSAQSLADDSAKVIIPPDIKWLKCPWCSEEWLKLIYTCGLCIDCGRDVRGFRRAIQRMPYGNTYNRAEVDISLNGYGKTFPREFRTAKMFVAEITFGTSSVLATANPDMDLPIGVIPKGFGERRFTDVMSAWRAIQKYFDGNGWDK